MNTNDDLKLLNVSELLGLANPVRGKNDPHAQIELGNRYREAKDFAEAVKWFECAAAQGSDDAKFKLAVIFEEDQGGLRNQGRAAELYDEVAHSVTARGEWDIPQMARKRLELLLEKEQTEYIVLARGGMIASFPDTTWSLLLLPDDLSPGTAKPGGNSPSGP